MFGVLVVEEQLVATIGRLQRENSWLVGRCLSEERAVSRASSFESENERLQLRVNRLLETNAVLMERVDRLCTEKERLLARVLGLEERLGLSSRNSSLPPSQGPLSVPPRSQHRSSGRVAGGQSGHDGHYRELLGAGCVDEVVEVWPSLCGKCEHKFSGSELVDCAGVAAHQTFELPEVAVEVTEHRMHKVCCQQCGYKTRSGLPDGVPQSPFGVRLQAAVATLGYEYRLGRIVFLLVVERISRSFSSASRHLLLLWSRQ